MDTDGGDTDVGIGNDGAQSQSTMPVGESVSHSGNGHDHDHSALRNPSLDIAPDTLAFDRGLSAWVGDRIRDGYLWAFLGAVGTAALIVYMARELARVEVPGE